MGIEVSAMLLVALIPALVIACLLGGAFGVLVLSNLSSQRVANQVFPFIILPQFFLAGIFSPIQHLPLPLEILSRLSPMRYAVDFVRNVYYAGSPEYPYVVLDSPVSNLALIAGMFVLFLGVGTFLFVRSERNR
jgi:ABC-2 type transport system permease protein